MLDALAQAESETVQRDAGLVARAFDEQLCEVRRHRKRGRADVRLLGVDRDIAPAENDEVLLFGNAFDLLHCLGAFFGLKRKECDSRRVVSTFRKVELDDSTQELVRQLQQDASTVTRGGLGAGGAAVLQVGQRCQGIAHDAVGTPALDVGHHGDTTGVALISRVVKTLGAGDGGEDHCADLLRRPR